MRYIRYLHHSSHSVPRQICNQEFELLDSYHCQKVSIESLHFANTGNEAVENQTIDNSSNEDISDENGNSEDDDTSNTVVEDQQPEVWEDVSPELL
ncbi:hypothetical protein AC249_AIPGENE10318 [Exaiptasia diaphana]|nr:hypothetical protein AC249_AIPGENE10318 [Exaiptasia diaphana]